MQSHYIYHAIYLGGFRVLLHDCSPSKGAVLQSATVPKSISCVWQPVSPTGVKWEGISLFWAFRRAATGANNARHERGCSQSPQQRIFLEVVFRWRSCVKSDTAGVLGEKNTAHEVFSSSSGDSRGFDPEFIGVFFLFAQFKGTTWLLSLVLHNQLILYPRGSFSGNFNV